MDGAEEDATNGVATEEALDVQISFKLSLTTEGEEQTPAKNSSVADSLVVNDSVTNDSSSV